VQDFFDSGEEKFLQHRREEGLLRELCPISARREGRVRIGGKEYLDLSSNDYLGLAEHPRLAEAAKQAMEAFGTSACASRLMSGDLDIHHLLEERVAAFKSKESALVFNSGYQANVGLFSALLTREDAVFSDRLNHASILDGIQLSGARLFRFRHNDPGHLETLLRKERGKFRGALIATETIFSMDGDRAVLRELVELKERHGCRMVVDEAHATGVFGANGSGVVEEEGLAGRIELVMGTFSKALGSFGAYLATSRRTVDFLVNRCRSFIYSTALPPAVIACNLAALSVVAAEPWRREALRERSGRFRDSLREKGFQVSGASQIVPVILGGNERTVSFAKALQEKGYWVVPVRPPTVPQGQARLRLTLTARHSWDTLRQLADDIAGIRI
jgi:8-amino-7-oxononanoate synthase